MCQPGLATKESGYLKVGEAPTSGVEDVKMTLNLIGSKAPVPATPEAASLPQDPTESEPELEAGTPMGKSISD